MRTPQEIKEGLARLAPSVALETIWEHDHDVRWGEVAGDAMNGEDPNDWQAWQSEVRATAIVAGKVIYGSGHLCGTWHRYGDDPEKVDPDIGGYFPQKAEEALIELRALVMKKADEVDVANLVIQIDNSINYLKREMRSRHEDQQREKVGKR